MQQEIRNLSSPVLMKSGWRSGLLQSKPPLPHAWCPATRPREAPRWRGAQRCLGCSHLWGTEPGSRTGAPDHFSNSQFQFSFESGCVYVRPILIPSDDLKPGFQFLLSHCTVGGGRAHGAAVFPTRAGVSAATSLNTSTRCYIVLDHSFGKAGRSSRHPHCAPLRQRGIARKYLRGHPRLPWASQRCRGHSRFHSETGSF